MHKYIYTGIIYYFVKVAVMGEFIKINAAAVSRGVEDKFNDDNFYINGRYVYHFRRTDTQVYIENEGEEFIFAVSDGMDKFGEDRTPDVSMMKELKKFQDHISGTGGDLVSKLGQMKERVDEINNVIYSMSMSNQENNEKQTAFAGMFIENGKVVTFGLGKCKIYLLRDGELRTIADDAKRADRLLKAGLLTDEEAKVLTSHYGSLSKDNKLDFQKTEVINVRKGDVFLLCSDGIFDALEEGRIRDILSMKKDAGFVANLLIEAVVKNEVKDNATALVVKVEDSVRSRIAKVSENEPVVSKKVRRRDESERKENIRTFIASGIACLLVIGLLAAVFYNAWGDNLDDGNIVATSTEGNTVKNTDSPKATPSTDNNDNTENNEAMAVISPTPEATAPSPTPEVRQEEPRTDNNTGRNTESSSTDKNYKLHVVKKGENLVEISRKYYGTSNKYTRIMEANGLKNPNEIEAGSTLKIPLM